MDGRNRRSFGLSCPSLAFEKTVGPQNWLRRIGKGLYLRSPPIPQRPLLRLCLAGSPLAACRWRAKPDSTPGASAFPPTFPPLPAPLCFSPPPTPNCGDLDYN